MSSITAADLRRLVEGLPDDTPISLATELSSSVDELTSVELVSAYRGGAFNFPFIAVRVRMLEEDEDDLDLDDDDDLDDEYVWDADDYENDNA